MTDFNDIHTLKIIKGTILLQKGDKCNYGFKVISGCLKSYVIDHSGKEHILQFAPEDWIISDLESGFNQTPSSIFIDAVEDTEYIKFGKNEFTNLDNSNNDTLIELNKKLIRNLISKNKRLIALLSATAEERYLEFIQTYPTLLQRLPLKLIASYLGMTPEYLSDVRRKLANK
jgi:CRP-like cAMP-binding protein